MTPAVGRKDVRGMIKKVEVVEGALTGEATISRSDGFPLRKRLEFTVDLTVPHPYFAGKTAPARVVQSVQVRRKPRPPE